MQIKIIVALVFALLLAACSTTPQIQTTTVPEGTDDYSMAQPEPAMPLPQDPPPAVENTVVSPDSESADAGQEYADVWQRIRDNLVLDRHQDNTAVKQRIAWYARNQDYLDRMAVRATPYIYHILEQLDERGMPLDLALLPVVESAYHPFAYSRSHASGIWQFIPGTGRMYGLKQNWWYDGRRDIVAATRGALDYLEKLNNQFDGDWQHALASYNSGEYNVERSIKRNQRAGKATDFFSLRLPRETRGYVPSLLAVAEIVANPEKYGIKLKSIPNQEYFKKIDIGGQIDLSAAAKLSGLSMDEFYTLNPGFNRWATDPDGPHYLLVPVDREEQFIAGLEQMPPEERMGWQQHVIAPGETLSQIADRYRTSVAVIKATNDLRGNLIRTGQSLVIPTAKEPGRYYTLSLENRWLGDLKRQGQGNQYTYTVRSGDSLWTISRRYDVSIKELIVWNNINPRGIIRPGQSLTLYIQTSGEDDKTADAAVARETTTTNEQGQYQYTVREGDSLWLIARRFDVTVAQVQQWNDLNRARYLQPGQTLILEIPAKSAGNRTAGMNAALDNYSRNDEGHIQYTVRKGDSLWLIARRFGVTIDQIMEWNKLSGSKYLQPGQTLVLQHAPALTTGA